MMTGFPECSMMSKGMGKSYLTPQMVRYHQSDVSRNYLTLEGGSIIALPRYYRERIYDEGQRYEQSLMSQAKSNLLEREREEEYISLHGTLDGYTREVFSRKTASLERFQAASKSNRNKV